MNIKLRTAGLNGRTADAVALEEVHKLLTKPKTRLYVRTTASPPPSAMSTLAIWNDRFTSAPAVRSAQIVILLATRRKGQIGPKCAFR